MALLVLVALTGALMPITSSETAIAANHRLALQTRYAAEAALERAIRELGAAGSWDDVLAGRLQSAVWDSQTSRRLADGAVLDLEVEAAELENAGAGRSGAGRDLPWRLFSHGPLDAVLPRDPSGGLLHTAVWVADDPADGDGDPLRDANGALLLHAAAIGPALAQRAVQATLTRPSPAQRPVVTSWTIVR
ncbi:MAG: hypothetical protein J4F30_08615 [Acidobacteria bacterium]|nr:hypothetical protein [Acidobacteriota bacterium]